MASLLLRSAGRSLLQRQISPARLMEKPRRLYSAGTKPQPDKASQLKRTQQDLKEENKALEERMNSSTGNLNRRLDDLQSRIDRLTAASKEMEAQYQKYDKWSLKIFCLSAVSYVAFLTKMSLYG
uniref:Uncharacterized protein n=1 Tax=Leersia perrieri TaxID=77586 RepID=A0A0D9XC25_9ORYZ